MKDTVLNHVARNRSTRREYFPYAEVGYRSVVPGCHSVYSWAAHSSSQDSRRRHYWKQQVNYPSVVVGMGTFNRGL